MKKLSTCYILVFLLMLSLVFLSSADAKKKIADMRDLPSIGGNGGKVLGLKSDTSGFEWVDPSSATTSPDQSAVDWEFKSVSIGTTGSVTEETSTLTFDDGDGTPITLQQIRDKQSALTNPVTGPSSPTTNYVPKWSGTGQGLVDGWPVSRSTGSAIPVLAASPGTPDGTKFLRDDGTWVVPTTGTIDITGLTEDTAPAGSYFIPVYTGSVNKKTSITNLLGTSGISDAVPFYSAGGVTKLFHFVASAITAGQNRAITLPDGDITIPAGTLLASGGALPSRDPVIGDPDSWTIAAADWYGGTLIANAAGEFSITPAVTGVNFALKVEGANIVIANPDATGTADTITLNGTALTQGQAIKSDGTAGALVVCQYRSANALSCDSDSHWAGE